MKKAFVAVMVGAMFIVAAMVVLATIATIVAWRMGYDSNIVSAGANIAVALGTLELALITVYGIFEGRRQAQEAQHALSRPLLVPKSTFDEPGFWNAPEHPLFIQNAGNGIATNVRGVILPPSDFHLDTSFQFSMRLNLPIANGERLEGVFMKGGTLFTSKDSIGNIPLAVPEGSFSSLSDRRDRSFARISFSYSDSFGLKHASIFDLTKTGVWVNVDIVKDIAQDLGDMNIAKGQ